MSEEKKTEKRSVKTKSESLAVPDGVASKKTAAPKRTLAPQKKAAPAKKTAAAGISPKTKASPPATAKKNAAGPRSKKKKVVGRDLADIVAAAAAEHKPIDPVLLNLSGRSSVADWFFIASAENPRQMAAIAEKIIRRAREHGVRPLGQEGLAKGSDHWVLVDLGDVVVHIFNIEARETYDLEGLWFEAPRRAIESDGGPVKPEG